MKKCMICGGQTLPGAKLCLPCRSALRRARDDTISELLPLPRRREALAFSHSPAIDRDAVLPSPRPVGERPNAGFLRGRLTSAQLHATAVIAFVAAAGVLTYVLAREMQRDRPVTPAPAVIAPATEPRVDNRVSPSTMLGAARSEAAPAPVGAEPELAAEAVVVAPPPIERKPERAAKPRAAAKAAPLVEAPPVAAATPEPPVIITLPKAVPAPAAVARAAPDRAQLFAAAMAKCGGDFFTRVACEHRARAQLCEGQWGQSAQCPAGIANDHGQ